MLMTVIVVSSNEIDNILTIFNSLHLRLQFTMEIGDNIINFLDLTIIINQKENQNLIGFTSLFFRNII